MKILNVLLLQLLFTATFGQDFTKEIESQFLDYNKLIIDKDYERAMDFSNPKMFDIIPKEQMVLLMERIMNNPDLEFNVYMPEVNDFAEPVEIDRFLYVKFNSYGVIEMKFLHDEEDEDETSKKLTRSLEKVALEKQFGEENVEFIEETGFYRMKTVKKVIASSDNKTDWKFAIVDNENSLYLLKRFIPNELLED